MRRQPEPLPRPQPAERRLDEQRQRALTRYYVAALYALHFFTTTDAARHVLFMGFCYAAVLVAPHRIYGITRG